MTQNSSQSIWRMVIPLVVGSLVGILVAVAVINILGVDFDAGPGIGAGLGAATGLGIASWRARKTG